VKRKTPIPAKRKLSEKWHERKKTWVKDARTKKRLFQKKVKKR